MPPSSPLTSYIPRTTPFAHQQECLAASYNKKFFAFLLDPGLGKTKITLDTAALLYEHNRYITALLIVAPNDVHGQWITEQIPLHLPQRIKFRALVWHTNRQSSQKAQRAFAQFLKPEPQRLTILAINHEALATQKGRDAARKFLKAHPTLMVLDDSHEFRTPAAARTRAANALSQLAKVRRILTGTLTGGSPFHLYSQFKFLHPKILNCDSYLTFKHRYGVWETRTVRSQKQHKLVEYEDLQGYQNLSELQTLIAPYLYAKHKEDCGDLPPKIYATVPTHLSAAQRALFDTLLEDGIALLERAASGHSVKVASLASLTEEDFEERLAQAPNRVSYQIKLTLLLRLQQCTAGIVTDDAGKTRWIDGAPTSCPRFVQALQWVQQALTSQTKVVVWSTFHPTLQALHEALPASVLIHGGITGTAREAALTAFKDPASPKRILIAHPRTMGTGQNFALAGNVLYYSRSFSYFQRAQSEDRAHRLSSKGAVLIADMVAADSSTDAKEMDALKQKTDMVKQFESFDPRALRRAPSVQEDPQC